MNLLLVVDVVMGERVFLKKGEEKNCTNNEKGNNV
jgi:hypothetical protein